MTRLPLAPTDTIACEPYAATIPARVCVARRQRRWAKGDARGVGLHGGSYPTCQRCAFGEAVERALSP